MLPTKAITAATRVKIAGVPIELQTDQTKPVYGDPTRATADWISAASKLLKSKYDVFKNFTIDLPPVSVLESDM